MKHAGQCPKCGSREIVLFERDGFPNDSQQGVMVGMTILSCVHSDRYICCNCGYSEQWFSQEAVRKLRQSAKAKKINE